VVAEPVRETRQLRTQFISIEKARRKGERSSRPRDRFVVRKRNENFDQGPYAGRLLFAPFIIDIDEIQKDAWW
jgi:archaeosine-15-forming tRNA-guanine transglycosylase